MEKTVFTRQELYELVWSEHYVLAEPGKAYAAYMHVPLPWKPDIPEKLAATILESNITVERLKDKYQVERISTKDGCTIQREQFKHKGGERKLDSPEFAVDIALRIITVK